MLSNNLVGAIGAISLAVIVPAAAQAGRFQTIYSFAGGNSDGANPQDALFYKDGVLYGTTERGGPGDAGAVFSYDLLSKTETILTMAMGTLPFTPVTFVGGNLFGTTSAADNGEGNIFSYNLTTGAVRDLYQFPPGPNLADPSGLTRVGQTLYGTTSSGGHPYYDGTIFSYDVKTRSGTTLYTFTGGTDGVGPIGLTAHNGMLYGVTLRGGANGDGTLYKFDPATNTKTILHNFAGAADGQWPNGFAFINNTIYGTALFGGANNQGALFRMDATTGAVTLLYSFTGGANGCLPFGRPAIFQGHFYSATGSCGNPDNQGVLFDYAITARKLTILHTFTNGPDGITPEGSLTLQNGTIFGTTSSGGTNNGGTIFKYTP